VATYAKFETTEGDFKIRLFEQEAPNTVANFVGLAGGPARLNPRVAADAPAQQRQPLQERSDANLEFRIIRRSR